MMKKRKLKKFVLPTFYVMIIVALFASIAMLGTSLQNIVDYSDEDLSVSTVNDEATPVISTEEEEEGSFIKPYTSEKVKLAKSYYDMKDEEQKQQNSLIFYGNTYLQNTGVLYSSDEVFDVLSVYDGEVSRIDSDEILGNVVEITHNNNLKTIYYSLSEINVKEQDKVSKGDIIAKSGDNGLESVSDNSLLFEVYYNGKAINPEEFYNMNIKDLG